MNRSHTVQLTITFKRNFELHVSSVTFTSLQLSELYSHVSRHEITFHFDPTLHPSWDWQQTIGQSQSAH